MACHEAENQKLLINKGRAVGGRQAARQTWRVAPGGSGLFRGFGIPGLACVMARLRNCRSGGGCRGHARETCPEVGSLFFSKHLRLPFKRRWPLNFKLLVETHTKALYQQRHF